MHALVPFCFLLYTDTTSMRSAVQSSLPPPPGVFARLLCLAPPPLKPLLSEQQVQLLCLAKTSFCNTEPMHFRLLVSLFAAFTG